MATLSMLNKYLQPKTPRAYRAGATLQRVMQNLRGLSFEQVSVTSASFSTRDSGIHGVLAEKLEPLLFAHMVTTMFRFELASPSSARFDVNLGHSGKLRRQGLSTKVNTGASETLEAQLASLTANAAVLTHWLPLDTKHCRLVSDDSGVYLEIEHFAGSEVVASFPNIRRYVRITPDQWQHLLKLIRALKQWWQISTP